MPAKGLVTGPKGCSAECSGVQLACSLSELHMKGWPQVCSVCLGRIWGSCALQRVPDAKVGILNRKG